jgi:galactonate dehydratase
MQITDVKTFLTMPRPGTPWLFVEVYTDEGVTGLGECTWYVANYLIAQTVESIKPLIIGLDPANIEEIWQRIFRRHLRLGGRGVISAAMSAIDIALWDIKGKTLGVPIYQLLGGPVRESVPLYTHVQDASYPDVTPQDAVAMALETRDAGFSAIKTDPFKLARQRTGPFQGASILERLTPRLLDEAVAWVTALREALGPEYELMVDAHARFDVPTAIKAARVLEHLDLTWFEEPVPPENHMALKQVRENTSVPISVGESLFTRYDFVPVLEQRLADYIMPDAAWTGGISELRRIGSMTEAYYLRFSPHDALGPVAIMSAFHVCMTTPNLYRQECIHSWFDEFEKIITPMFEHHDGALWPSDRPGLGIEINHEAAAQYALDPMDPRANRRPS